MTTSNELIEWDIDVSILTNRYILREVLRVLAISAFIVVLIVFFISLPQLLQSDGLQATSSSGDWKYAAILIGIWLVLTIVFVLLYYGNAYSITYRMNQSELWFITKEIQKKKNQVINWLLILFGLASGHPGYIGTGLISMSRQNMGIKISKVQKAIFYNKHSTIALKCGFGTKMLVFCKPEKYCDSALFLKRTLPKNCNIIVK